MILLLVYFWFRSTVVGYCIVLGIIALAGRVDVWTLEFLPFNLAVAGATASVSLLIARRRSRRWRKVSGTPLVKRIGFADAVGCAFVFMVCWGIGAVLVGIAGRACSLGGNEPRHVPPVILLFVLVTILAIHCASDAYAWCDRRARGRAVPGPPD
mgnify:FL=1